MAISVPTSISVFLSSTTAFATSVAFVAPIRRSVLFSSGSLPVSSPSVLLHHLQLQLSVFLPFFAPIPLLQSSLLPLPSILFSSQAPSSPDVAVDRRYLFLQCGERKRIGKLSLQTDHSEKRRQGREKAQHEGEEDRIGMWKKEQQRSKTIYRTHTTQQSRDVLSYLLQGAC